MTIVVSTTTSPLSTVISDQRATGIGTWVFISSSTTLKRSGLGRTGTYLRDLEEIYNGEIPKEIIQKAARYITEFIDLSDFTPELIRTLTWSKHFKPPPEVRDRIYAHLVSHGYDYEQIKGVHAHWTPDLIQSIAKNKPLLVRLGYDPHCTWSGTLTHTHDPDDIEKGDTIRILEYEASRDSKRVKVKRWEPVD